MFLPSKRSEAAAVILVLRGVERIVDQMSQKLEAAIAALGAKEDALIALVNTDISAIESLKTANAALVLNGNDDAAVAEVQALIDKLTPVLSASEPQPAPVPDPPVVVPAPAAPDPPATVPGGSGATVTDGTGVIAQPVPQPVENDQSV